MENHVNELPQYIDSYIAFLDLLGFKNMIGKKPCSEILSIFERIKVPIREIYMSTGEEWKPIIDNDIIKQVKIKIISDSICFYIDSSVKNAFCTLLSVCLMFQVEMAQLGEPVLMRGGIVRGEVYAKGDVTFGPGLTKAYLLEEKNAKYPRIIVTGEVLETALNETEEKCKQIIHNYIYRDMDAFYTVNYMGMLPCGPDGIIPAKNFYDKIIETLNRETDSSIREKYLYLEKNMKEVLISLHEE